MTWLDLTSHACRSSRDPLHAPTARRKRSIALAPSIRRHGCPQDVRSVSWNMASVTIVRLSPRRAGARVRRECDARMHVSSAATAFSDLFVDRSRGTSAHLDRLRARSASPPRSSDRYPPGDRVRDHPLGRIRRQDIRDLFILWGRASGRNPSAGRSLAYGREPC